MTTKYNSLMLWACLWVLTWVTDVKNIEAASTQVRDQTEKCLNYEITKYLISESEKAPEFNLANLSYLDWLWVRPENWDKVNLFIFLNYQTEKK